MKKRHAKAKDKVTEGQLQSNTDPTRYTTGAHCQGSTATNIQNKKKFEVSLEREDYEVMDISDQPIYEETF